MQSISRYFMIWLASARYSLVRATMFRGDLFIWSTVELLWISVNVVVIAVIYSHTRTVAGWSQYEMLLLVGTSMLIQRFLMGFFWSGIFEMGRNVRSGLFDFTLAQPGDPLFMASTRKLELDGLLNSVVAGGLVAYSAWKLGLHPGAGALLLYGCMVACGVVIHYSALVMAMSLAFWITSSQGVEGSYFSLMEFSRLPREAFKGLASTIFVWVLPVVIVSNGPARELLHGFQPSWAAGLSAATAAWFVLAVIVFRRGLRRYTSASS
ncbi:MAG: ABC-2 family transporter protein [Opitutaceae bacterium]|jgi:ABC-2 type transport system permease protein